MAHQDEIHPSGDTISELSSSLVRHRNPFSTPSQRTASSTGGPRYVQSQNWFQSRRVKRGTVEKPWIGKKDPREKCVNIIPLIGLILGFIGAGILVWDGFRRVVNYEYCLVLDEDWSKGFNQEIWTKEAEVGGFGNGEFEETTSTDENAFIKDSLLHIKATLQDESLITTNNSIINLINSTTGTTCASTRFSDCVAITNLSNGTIVPPTKSARVTTRHSKSIKYGRVEVTGKLPRGDWLWPAIWMLPVNYTYGQWPKSGEIDIAESRGNEYTYPNGGNSQVSSSLHWGPDPINDGWWRTLNHRVALHTTYADDFHVFGMEWSEKYLFTYIDNRILQVLFVNFDEPLWKKGNFPLAYAGNGTRLIDPWSQTGRFSTPFDEDFYLILSLGVGGTNGWFLDGLDQKPWVDSSDQAKLDFWKARDKWWPTWQQGGGEMAIKSVKMWQQKGYKGC